MRITQQISIGLDRLISNDHEAVLDLIEEKVGVERGGVVSLHGIGYRAAAITDNGTVLVLEITAELAED